MLIFGILREIISIVLIILLNLTASYQVLRTPYSINEREWVCQSLTEIALIFSGITIFKVLTIGISQVEVEFRIKAFVLLMF